MEIPSTRGQSYKGDSYQPTGTSQVMVFYPTWQEFKDFPGYIKKIEQAGAHFSCGIAKIVPPKEFNPRPKRGTDYSDVDNYVIKEPVKETIDGAQGIYVKSNKVFKKQLSVKEFRKFALSSTYKNPKPNLEGAELESLYWRSICKGEPIYGADTEGSIYEKGVHEWNMAQLGTILDDTKNSGVDIKGVTSVYLYFGMWKTTFPWHAEDMDLYSINYLHFGEPKYWYAISSESANRFERLMQQTFPDESQHCRSFLRHKNFIVSPTILRSHNIPYGTMIQRPNEFIITFPHGYHMGFNSGYNCAESTNFASDRWIDYGKNAHICRCRPDSVEIDMRPYMMKYRPKHFDAWFNYWYAEKRIVLKGRNTKRNHLQIAADAEDSMPETTKWRKDSSSPLHQNAATIQPAAIKESSKKSDKSTARKKLASKGLDGLWASSAVNLYAERCWNEKRALEAPHCAICQYFQPVQQLVFTKSVPESSQRLISFMCFAKDPLRMPKIPDPNEDSLLSCDSCAVTVHRNCYALMESDNNIWLCQRCSKRSPELIRGTTCHLCELRGGAFMRCVSGRESSWVHVICAILSRRTSFDDPATRLMASYQPPPKHGYPNEDVVTLSADYMDALGAEHEVAEYECELCGRLRESLIKCAACEGSREPVYVHATCGRVGKMFVERREYPLVAVLVCDKHENYFDSDEETSEISSGEEVIVSLDSEVKVERGSVMQKFENEYAMLDFCDGSFSKNTPFEDIVTCECVKCDRRYHQSGARIRVRWTDSKLYDAYYRGAIICTEYWVRLHSSPKSPPIILARSDIFTHREMLPEQLKNRLENTEKNDSQ
ncbi:unnamed protein product, partial [Mesorhabditis belari]|uniref:[histone H3]-trimethyl-L-lysine(9) demethylase n=1 Tax=Mesorhabditis belari TaxID=2138241 RepID=A0AAF3EHT6_9BILA